jgi:hybrid cluster-associated redox disulfide protein
MSKRTRKKPGEAGVNPRWTIAEILGRWPQATSVFTRLRMACVGCPMAAFETPAEAAKAYGLAPEAVLGALARAIRGGTVRCRVRHRGTTGEAKAHS